MWKESSANFISQLDKESRANEDGENAKDNRNCCVTFADSENAIFAERHLARGGQNCCVRFEPSRTRGEKRMKLVVVLFTTAVMGFFFTVIMIAVLRSGRKD
jgi:hypothetical protein